MLALGQLAGAIDGKFCYAYYLAIFDNKPLCTFGMLQEYLVQNGVDVKDDELEADIAYLRELELINFLEKTVLVITRLKCR